MAENLLVATQADAEIKNDRIITTVSKVVLIPKTTKIELYQLEQFNNFCYMGQASSVKGIFDKLVANSGGQPTIEDAGETRESHYHFTVDGEVIEVDAFVADDTPFGGVSFGAKVPKCGSLDTQE